MSSQRESSQPATLGGLKRRWPAPSDSQTQDDVSIAAVQAAQEPGDVDDRRLHHAWAGVQGGVAQDRVEHRAHFEALLVQLLEGGLRACIRWNRDEVAPQLANEERRVLGMVNAE